MQGPRAQTSPHPGYNGPNHKSESRRPRSATAAGPRHPARPSSGMALPVPAPPLRAPSPGPSLYPGPPPLLNAESYAGNSVSNSPPTLMPRPPQLHHTTSDLMMQHAFHMYRSQTSPMLNLPQYLPPLPPKPPMPELPGLPSVDPESPVRPPPSPFLAPLQIPGKTPGMSLPLPPPSPTSSPLQNLNSPHFTTSPPPPLPPPSPYLYPLQSPPLPPPSPYLYPLQSPPLPPPSPLLSSLPPLSPSSISKRPFDDKEVNEDDELARVLAISAAETQKEDLAYEADLAQAVQESLAMNGAQKSLYSDIESNTLASSSRTHLHSLSPVPSAPLSSSADAINDSSGDLPRQVESDADGSLALSVQTHFEAHVQDMKSELPLDGSVSDAARQSPLDGVAPTGSDVQPQTVSADSIDLQPIRSSGLISEPTPVQPTFVQPTLVQPTPVLVVSGNGDLPAASQPLEILSAQSPQSYPADIKAPITLLTADNVMRPSPEHVAGPSRPSTPINAAASQFVEPSLLQGVSMGFHSPVITDDIVSMCGPVPNVLQLPFGASPPLHLKALSWRDLLKLMARLGGTRIEAGPDAFASLTSTPKLRTVIQFVRVHSSSVDWHIVIYLSVDVPIATTTRNAWKFTQGDPNVLPWSYTLSLLPKALGRGHDTALSKFYTIPPTLSTGFPNLPITLPNMALYLQAALEESRKAMNDSTSGVRKLAKMINICFPTTEAKIDDDDISSSEKFTGIFKKVMGRGGKHPKHGRTPNEHLFELVTPFVPDEWSR